QRLQAPLAGHLGAGPTLGLVGEVEVLEHRTRVGGAQLRLQLRGQQPLLFDRTEDGVATTLQRLELSRKLKDLLELDLIEASGGLLPVASEEGDGGALFTEREDGLHLPGAEGEGAGDGADDGTGHRAPSLPLSSDAGAPEGNLRIHANGWIQPTHPPR